jgi:hypothetical protein
MTLIDARYLGFGVLLVMLALSPLAARSGKSAQGEPEPSELLATADPSSQTALAAEPSPYCLARFLTPLRMMGGIGESSTSASALFPGAVSHVLNALKEKLGSRTVVETLIATIADPIDSGLGYQYDTSLQALRLGVEHAGSLLPAGGTYYRDRSWLPWDDRDVDAASRAESEACRKTTPGLMLFRNSDADEPRVLLLLLVGETPTSGLRLPAMLNALRVVSAVTARTASFPLLADVWPFAASIVGPTFSGSAHSLRLALKAWAAQHVGGVATFRLVTGSASGADLPAILGGEGWLSPHGTSFRATTVSEADLTCRYLGFLHHRLGVSKLRAHEHERADESTPPRLRGVAMLHEAGTEFGAAATRSVGADAKRSSHCNLIPELDIAFPVHISALRDAYESVDQSDPDAPRIARRTALEVSLHENRAPLEIEGNPSPKTKNAEDLAIINLLSQISRRQIGHIGIHATDIGDAIFLARKIRDVAPDVRLAFFAADALLTHPSFRRLLLGSLVITPYPFLGADDLASSLGNHSLRAFESSLAEGVFNATLAARGVDAHKLLQYKLPDSSALLPTWVATTARTGLVPISVKPTLDCARTILGQKQQAVHEQVLCGEREGDPRKAWKAFDSTVRTVPLRIDDAVSLPRFWHFVYALMIIAFVCDGLFQRKARMSLSTRPMPGRITQADDHASDLAMGRTKWLLYAAIRGVVFMFAFLYMGALYALSLGARDTALDFASLLLAVLALSLFSAALFMALCACARFLRDYKAFACAVRASLAKAEDVPRASALPSGLEVGELDQGPACSEDEAEARLTEVELRRSGLSVSDAPEPRRLLIMSRLLDKLGLEAPVDRLKTAEASLGQLRVVVVFAVLVTVLVSCLLCGELRDSTDWDSDLWHAATAWTLLVLRTVPLLNGVSSAAPILLCLACVYAWCVGRMARIHLAHRLSRVSPSDQEADLVSTPLRVVLHPSANRCVQSDAGFTHLERDVVNAIWRPITGPYYSVVVCMMMIIPTVLFAIKRPSTIEGAWGSALLAVGLVLCLYLIGVTVVQLIMYWLALEKLLKRVMEHRLGPAFASVPPFVRDSLNDQLSRSPHDLLRWTGCLRDFADLVSSGGALGTFAGKARECMQKQLELLGKLRTAALVQANEDDRKLSARSESLLGQGIVQAAADVTDLLQLAWSAQLAELRGEGLAAQAAPCAVEPAHDDTRAATAPKYESAAAKADDVSDSLTPVAFHYSPTELFWLRKAQRFAATVVTILINLHMRQFRHFLFTLSASSLLLLATVTSYTFEPYRLLLTLAWTVIVSVMLIGIWIFVELDRNTVISHISGTVPGKLTVNGGMAVRLFSWSVVPLLGIASTQYPEVANFLYAIINPFLSALK